MFKTKDFSHECEARDVQVLLFKDGAYILLLMRTCSAHHASISLSARAGFDTDAINFAINYFKAKFSYCNQIKFNEPVLNQEHQKSSI